MAWFGKLNKSADDFGFAQYRYFYLAVIGYLAMVGISVLVSINTGESLYEWGKTILPFVLLVYMVRSFRSSTVLSGNLPVVISIAGLAVGLIGMAQIFSLAFVSLPGNVIPYATMANRNLFASYLILSLPFALITVRSPRIVIKIMGATTVVVILFTIIASQTRAVWVALAVAGVAALIMAAITRKSRGAAQAAGPSSGRFSSKKIIVVSVIVALAFVVLGNSVSDWNLADRARSIVNREDGSIADRLDIWSRSLEMAREYPILGVGPGQWRVHIAGYGVEGTRSESGVTHFQRPHNDYLWVLCENGPLGLLFYMLMFGMVGRTALNKLVRSKSLDEYWQTVYCLFGLIAYLVVAFFSYPQERIIHQMLLMVLIAYLIAAPISPTRNIRPTIWKMKFALPVVFIILSLVVAIMASIRLHSEKEMQRIYKWRDLGRWLEVISATDRSENFMTVMDPTAAPLSWYRGVAQFSLDDRDAAFESFVRAYQINPNHLHVLNNLGTSYELKGDHDRARFYYQKALEISPRFEDAVLNLTAILYNAGQFGEALGLIKRIEAQHCDPRYDVFLERIEAALSQ